MQPSTSRRQQKPILLPPPLPSAAFYNRGAESHRESRSRPQSKSRKSPGLKSEAKESSLFFNCKNSPVTTRSQLGEITCQRRASQNGTLVTILFCGCSFEKPAYSLRCCSTHDSRFTRGFQKDRA